MKNGLNMQKHIPRQKEIFNLLSANEASVLHVQNLQPLFCGLPGAPKS